MRCDPSALDELGIGDHFYEGWALVRECPSQGAVEFVDVGDALAVRAAELGVRGKLRVVQRRLPHVPFGGALLLGILPSWQLFSSTCVMFMPYFTAVVSSARYWPNPPSPRDADDRSFGSAAAHAPIAAGNPKPIDPR